MEEQEVDFKGNKDVTQTCVLWIEKTFYKRRILFHSNFYNNEFCHRNVTAIEIKF